MNECHCQFVGRSDCGYEMRRKEEKQNHWIIELWARHEPVNNLVLIKIYIRDGEYNIGRWKESFIEFTFAPTDFLSVISF